MCRINDPPHLITYHSTWRPPRKTSLSSVMATFCSRVMRTSQIPILQAVGHRDTESRDPMRRDTIFQIQSMTKPVTALAAMILLEEGLLRLNDPVEMYLPEFRGQTLARSAGVDEQTAEQQPVRPITIRDLLTHTSGMPHESRTPGDHWANGALRSRAGRSRYEQTGGRRQRRLGTLVVSSHLQPHQRRRLRGAARRYRDVLLATGHVGHEAAAGVVW
jgi:CubicO group peptidase (beta-lactamase class C family)